MTRPRHSCPLSGRSGYQSGPPGCADGSGGLEQTESVEVLGISESTVRRELRIANAWLRSRLSELGATGTGRTG